MNPRTLIFSLFLLVPSTALAHAELESSSIEDGATVTGPLTEVSLTFTEAAELGFSTFKVYPLPAEAVGDATAGRSEDPDGTPVAEHDEEAGSHDEAAQAETEHGEGEHTGDATTTDAVDDHGGEGEHGALDAAAETLMAEVISVQDDQDARADTGVSPSEGQSETVTLRLKEELEPGAYAVMWKVLSVDAHTIEGFLTFTYDPGE